MSLDAAITDAVRSAVREALAEQNAVPRLALTVAETATSLGRSRQFVYDLIDAGELPARKVGPNGHLMVPVEAVRSWLMDGAA